MCSCFRSSLVSERGFSRSAKASRTVSKDWSTKYWPMGKTGQLPKLNQTDSHQHSEGRWPQASARIYLDPQMDSRFQEAYLKPSRIGIKRVLLTLKLSPSPARQISWLRRWMTEVLLWQERRKVRPPLNRTILVCNGASESLLSVQSWLWLFLWARCPYGRTWVRCMRLVWTIQMRSLSCNLRVPFMVSRKRMLQTFEKYMRLVSREQSFPTLFAIMEHYEQLD